MEADAHITPINHFSLKKIQEQTAAEMKAIERMTVRVILEAFPFEK